MIQKCLNVRMSTWFVERLSKLDDLRFFIFHHAGGGASYYRPMLNLLSNNVSVYLVQFPGREYRISEESYGNSDVLAEDLIKVLLPYLDKPFVFMGHSMGGLVSFELAHRLKKDFGISPAHLFLSSVNAPHIDKRIKFNKLNDQQLLSELCDLGGMNTEVSKNSRLMELILPILRKDLKLCDSFHYEWKERLDIPVTIMGGNKDSIVDVKRLSEWQAYFDNAFHLCIFEGNHFYFKNDFQLLVSTMMKMMKMNDHEMR